MLTPIELQPLPTSAAIAARQASSLGARANALGLEGAKDEALDAMLAVSPTDPPSERKRLRLLYRQVYSSVELRDLIARSFSKLGLEE
ncbi:MAG: hypothetical protein WD397_05470 [Wenzhouxiangellaceae bacterium]